MLYPSAEITNSLILENCKKISNFSPLRQLTKSSERRFKSFCFRKHENKCITQKYIQIKNKPIEPEHNTEEIYHIIFYCEY